MIECIEANTAIPGISMAVVVKQGETVFLSGHIPVNEDGSVETGDLEAQLHAAFGALHRTLKAAGCKPEGLVRITLFIRDYQPSELDLIRAVRDQYVSTVSPPASALLGVASLVLAAIRVEIDAIAVRP